MRFTTSTMGALLRVYGPDGKTRTCDPNFPKVVRYQTALHPDQTLSDSTWLELRIQSNVPSELLSSLSSVAVGTEDIALRNLRINRGS